MMIYHIVYRITIIIVYPVFVLHGVIYRVSSEMENANQSLLLSQHARHPLAFFADLRRFTDSSNSFPYRGFRTADLRG